MKYIFLLIVLAAITVIGWLIFRTSESPSATSIQTPTTTPTATPTQTPTTTSVEATPTPGLIVQEASIHRVTIRSFAYEPSTVTVRSGDVVIFTNLDSTPHTVTSTTSGVFESGTMSLDAQWTFATANIAPGTYVYYCRFHPSMKGTIIIQ